MAPPRTSGAHPTECYCAECNEYTAASINRAREQGLPVPGPSRLSRVHQTLSAGQRTLDQYGIHFPKMTAIAGQVAKKYKQSTLNFDGGM